jgi:hypothetical protein
MKITVKEFNVVTGEETIIERDETADELKARNIYETEQAERLTLKAKAETAKAEATAKLAALGLTSDDLKALGLGAN